MRMRWIEKTALNSRLRAWLMRRFEAPRLLGGVSLPGRDAVLEIGCGNGTGSLLISRYLDVNRIVALDVDPEMLRRARRAFAPPPRWARDIRTDHIRLLQADGSRLPFADACFDGVVVFDVLHHLANWRGCLREVFRVLKPGGMLCLAEATIPDHPLAFNRYWGHVPFGVSDLRQALAGAFTLERIDIFRACFLFARGRKAPHSA